MAPAESQQAIEEFGRPSTTSSIADNPIEVPLDAKALVAAFDRWDREVGGAKVEEVSRRRRSTSCGSDGVDAPASPARTRWST